MMVDDTTDITTTFTSEEDSKGYIKTMKIEKTDYVDPFSATHASMKDIDMGNFLTKIE